MANGEHILHNNIISTFSKFSVKQKPERPLSFRLFKSIEILPTTKRKSRRRLQASLRSTTDLSS
jgi:hypothetical protein